MKLWTFSNLHTCNTLIVKAIKRTCIVKYDMILSVINTCRIEVPTFKHNALKQNKNGDRCESLGQCNLAH